MTKYLQILLCKAQYLHICNIKKYLLNVHGIKRLKFDYIFICCLYMLNHLIISLQEIKNNNNQSLNLLQSLITLHYEKS